MKRKFDYSMLHFDESPASSGSSDDGKAAGGSAGDATGTGTGAGLSDADIAKITDALFGRIQSQQAEKDKSDAKAKAAKDADEEAKKLDDMADSDRMKYELDATKAKLAAMEAANAQSARERTVRGILDAENVHFSDATVTLLASSGDGDAAVASTKALLKDFDKAVQAAVRAKLGHGKPSVGSGSGTGSGGSAVDWDKIMKEPDVDLRLKAIDRALASGAARV